MIKRLIAAAILFVLILFLALNTGVLLIRVAEAEGLIDLKDETVDTYEYPKEARWMKYDLTRKNDEVRDDKVYVTLSEVSPGEDPGDGFSIVDKDDNLYPQMPEEEDGRVVHTLYKADYGWEWRSIEDVSLKTGLFTALKPVIRHPIGIKASAFDKDKDRFILASVINFLAALVVIMVPGTIIYKLVKRSV